jgi:hypothetical protein
MVSSVLKVHQRAPSPRLRGEGWGEGQRSRHCRFAAPLVLLLLAACGGPAGGGWSKPGADDAQTASAYQDCLAATATATRTDADIDQDIAASRASDLQHSSILREHARQTRDDSRDRAEAMLASCMQAKGFAQATK